jgi:FkbM family methyltransferase
MSPSVKEALRHVIHASGYEIGRTSVYTSQKVRHRLLFTQLQIDLLLDVGANTGQFASDCRAAGYKGRIISFEPSTAAHSGLLQSAAPDPLWTVADRTALGAITGEAEINIAANSVSSSILPMLDTHLSAAPASRYLRKEIVPLRRLDDVLSPTDRTCRIYLKLDVQGYESEVLAGATGILPQVRAIQLEMSLLPLYEGETLMLDMCAKMAANGFELWSLEPGFRDPVTGRLLQADGIFAPPSFH